MSTHEYLVDFRNKFLDPAVLTKSFEFAVVDLSTQMSERIFQEGKNEQGSLTGHGAYNDNKPLYVNPSTSPGRGFTPAGKPFEFGKTKGGKTKTVRAQTRLVKGENKPHKTRWFSSYKDYRKTIGKPTDRVTLDLSGDLRFDFASKRKGGSQNPVKINDYEFQLVLNRDKNAEKRKGLEERYNNKIFQPSDKEQKDFLETLNFQIQKKVA
jgi:hypothetical protein